MDLSKPWSGAYATTNSQYGAFDSKAAASMHASSTTAFGKLSITGQKAIPEAALDAAAALIQGAVAAVPRTLLLVSDNLPEHEMLIKATLATTTVVAVKYDGWSLADLGDAISKSAPAGAAFDAVGILDHGAPGRFCLLKSVGGGDIDLADLATDASIAAFFKGIGSLVKPGGRIDLLGCSVAAGPEGRALLAQVEALAGVTVTASTDKTGGAADADWEMETHGVQVGVTVTASTDKTGGAADADWEMETHGVQVGAQYFDVEALKEWKQGAGLLENIGWGLLMMDPHFRDTERWRAERAAAREKELASMSEAEKEKESREKSNNMVMYFIIKLFADADDPETIELSALQSALHANSSPQATMREQDASARLDTVLERLEEREGLVRVREGKIWLEPHAREDFERHARDLRGSAGHVPLRR